SESALEMNVKPYGDDLYLLTYNSEYASPADVNKIDLTYLFGGARVSRTIYFDPAEGKVAVLPKGVVRFEQTGSLLRGTIQLRVNGAQAEVRELVFWNPADGARFAAAKVEPARIAQGERTLSFEMSAAPARSMNELDVVKGRLVVCNPADGKTAEINFILPYKLTTK
ncbi:hypothetical protein, partial [Alistipes finegoldii]